MCVHTVFGHGLNTLRFAQHDGVQRFLRVLPLRLRKFGLRLNAQKTHLLACGKRLAWQAFRAGRHLPSFDFLGFTHYWGQSRSTPTHWRSPLYSTTNPRYNRRLQNGVEDIAVRSSPG